MGQGELPSIPCSKGLRETSEWGCLGGAKAHKALAEAEGVAQARKFSGPKGATGHSAGEPNVQVVVWPSALREGKMTLKGTAELSTLRDITGGGQ